VSDGGAQAYTRAGAFSLNNNGYVVNDQGQRLQTYPPTATGFNTSTLTDLQLQTTDSPPQATSNVGLNFNLPSNASQPSVATFNPADPNSYNKATSMTVYDSLGAAHTASMYFVKTAAQNAWTAQLYVDGAAVGTPQALAYTTSGAIQTPASPSTVTYPGYNPTTGAAPITLTIDFSKSTQFGDNFSVNAVTQDGFTTGRMIGIDVDSTGVVQARFTNGRSISLGQVAIANFANPQGLQQLGNTQWAETFSSGQPLRSQAGNSGVGLIQSGALEASNVDITNQLVNMITAQRNFQANAQMISTADSITQTIINIR
jgi:flagellar hook protein FlgE